MANATVTVEHAGRATAEGTAEYNGIRYSWMAYRENERSIRVMLSRDGKWLQRQERHPLRMIVKPYATEAMKPL